ncbi:MAG: hypothetical protein ACFFE8_00680 [Candidatus Heimdallarchaeota archaeon]
MSHKRTRKTLFELANQPELWIFSNVLAEPWVKVSDLTVSTFEKTVEIPITLPSGTCIFKLESDGPLGQIISMCVAHGSEICLFHLTNNTRFEQFKRRVLEYITNIIPNYLEFYSYMGSYYNPKFRDIGLADILGPNMDVKDLAEFGTKSRILQRVSDPIEGYEIPQYWRVLDTLGTSMSDRPSEQKRLVMSLQVKACDILAKHAVIDTLRCAIIALKHYADLLDELQSESKRDPWSDHHAIAEGLFKLGNFQDAAVFYSKCLSQPSFDKQDQRQEQILKALKASIDQLGSREFLEYALMAAKIARSRHLER